jgi:hypothetical protein
MAHILSYKIAFTYQIWSKKIEHAVLEDYYNTQTKKEKKTTTSRAWSQGRDQKQIPHVPFFLVRWPFQ